MSRKAFVFGSNYKDTVNELSCCIRDCERMSDTLGRRGFHVEREFQQTPLIFNEIISKLNRFVDLLKSGDSVVIYWSGHGMQVLDTDRDEKDHLDEALYIDDGHQITDDILRILLQKVPRGVNVFGMFDTCHSGSMFDLPYKYDNLKFSLDSRYYFNANIVLLSGCDDPNVSYESDGTGLLTRAFLDTIEKWRPCLCQSMPWVDLYVQVAVRLQISSTGYQVPKISFSNTQITRTMWL